MHNVPPLVRDDSGESRTTEWHNSIHTNNGLSSLSHKAQEFKTNKVFSDCPLMNSGEFKNNLNSPEFGRINES